ncbi:vWA domain-containing protein [Tundrisphaera sp. TA3]|uniref:vWA domain-containing protein n=1 Tax=Tundrisphaera sp. TA3 TaxID=3435775 RepID=UPI003EBAE7E4
MIARWLSIPTLAWLVLASSGPARAVEGEAAPDATTVTITQADESNFPEISVYFEVAKAGVPLLNAGKEEFRVVEEDQERPILAFEAPETLVKRPTTVVLVLDRSRSMLLEGRIVGLKAAVARFLDGLPRGSRVAVIAFSSSVELILPFTEDMAAARRAVESLEADGGTHYYDAVAAALELLRHEAGRRAILAMTDGEDTSNRPGALDAVILESRRLNLPIHTLGLGTGPQVTSGSLARLASETRGQAYSARDAGQLRSIYEEIARRQRTNYRLSYRTDRPTQDGTLRPIRVFHREAARAAHSAVFIRGMVAPAPGWPGLFLVLLGLLGLLAILPGRIAAGWRRG